MTAPDEDAELARLARVDEIVTEAVERSRGGESIDVEAIVGRHPELATELRAALKSVARLELAAETVSSEVDDVPDTIGSYRIVRLLGRGGMGLVYEAHDESLDRRVALKLLTESSARRRGFVERFEREAHAAARLDHSSVVPVYGVDEVDGRPFIVMKYIDGVAVDHPDVRPNLDRSPVKSGSSASGSSASSHEPGPIEVNVARFGLACAEAIALAHAHGVLHRDIKPSNILVDRRGHPWITDFGLAKLDEHEDDLTREGDFIGTLRYTAPEQFQGEAEPRSDVYALGLVLYELATGQPAQQARTRSELVHELMYVLPKSPDRVRADVPPDLSRIIMKALAKLPEERYETADDLALDLRAFLAGRPIAARVPSAMYLARLAVNRNPPAFAGAAIILLLVVVSALLYGLQLRHAARSEELLAYHANIAAASSSIAMGDAVTARRRLDDCAESLRGWEWRHLDAGVDQSVRTITRTGRPVRALVPMDDGLRVDHDGGVEIHVGSEATLIPSPTTVTKNRTFVRAVRWKDKWVAYHLQSGFWHLPSDGIIRRSSTDDSVLLPPGRNAPSPMRTTLVAMRDQAERFALSTRSGSILVFDSETLEEIYRAPHGVGGVDAIDCDDDVETIALAGFDGRVVLWDVDDRSSRDVYQAASGLHAVDYRPDLDRVAVGGDDRSVVLVRASTGELLHQFVGHSENVLSVQYSPDGSLVASGGVDRTVRVWRTDTGEIVQTLRGHSSPIHEIAFSPDGSTLWSGSDGGVVKEWKVGVTGAFARASGHVADVPALAMSPSGKQFATGGRDGTVRIFDLASSRLDLLMIGHESELWGLAWHDDGRALCSVARDGLIVDWDTTTGTERWRVARRGIAATPAVDDERGRVFVGTLAGTLVALDGGDGSVLNEVSSDGLHVSSSLFDARRSRLLVGTLEGELLCVDPDTLEVLERHARHEDLITGIALSPDGAKVSTASDDRTLVISPAVRLDEIVRSRVGAMDLTWQSEALNDVAVSPDGERIAVASHNRLVRIADPATGDVILDLSGHESWARAVEFSSDGRTLVSTGSIGDVYSWDDRTTVERAETIDARVELEVAGRAVLARRLGREVETLIDVDEAFARLDGPSSRPSDLARATRAVLHRARADSIRSYHELELARQWSVVAANRARTWYWAHERRRPIGVPELRLKVLIHVVKGDLNDASISLGLIRDLAGEASRKMPVVLALEAHLAKGRGEESNAANLARKALVEQRSDADERAITEAILARL